MRFAGMSQPRSGEIPVSSVRYFIVRGRDERHGCGPQIKQYNLEAAAGHLGTLLPAHWHRTEPSANLGGLGTDLKEVMRVPWKDGAQVIPYTLEEYFLGSVDHHIQ